MPAGGLGRFLTQLDLHSDMGELGGSGYATVPGQGDGVYGRTDSGLSQVGGDWVSGMHLNGYVHL